MIGGVHVAVVQRVERLVQIRGIQHDGPLHVLSFIRFRFFAWQAVIVALVFFHVKRLFHLPLDDIGRLLRLSQLFEHLHFLLLFFLLVHLRLEHVVEVFLFVSALAIPLFLQPLLVLELLHLESHGFLLHFFLFELFLLLFLHVFLEGIAARELVPQKRGGLHVFEVPRVLDPVVSEIVVIREVDVLDLFVLLFLRVLPALLLILLLRVIFKIGLFLFQLALGCSVDLVIFVDVGLDLLVEPRHLLVFDFLKHLFVRIVFQGGLGLLLRGLFFWLDPLALRVVQMLVQLVHVVLREDLASHDFVVNVSLDVEVHEPFVAVGFLQSLVLEFLDFVPQRLLFPFESLVDQIVVFVGNDGVDQLQVVADFGLVDLSAQLLLNPQLFLFFPRFGFFVLLRLSLLVGPSYTFLLFFYLIFDIGELSRLLIICFLFPRRRDTIL